MSDWVKRDYDRRTDEDAVVYLWLKSYAHAKHNVAAGAHRDAGAKDETHPERRYWRGHAPIVEKLLHYGETHVLCDPERCDGSNGPPSILAFACVNGDVVHYVSVKRDYARAGFGPDMVRDLLGTRLARACTFTHELVEMAASQTRAPPCGVAVPVTWRPDPWWLARQLLGGPRRAA